MNTITTTMSLVNWKTCFMAMCIFAIICIIVATLEARLNGEYPRFTRLTIITSSCAIGAMIFVYAVKTESILYLGNDVYALLAIVIVAVAVALIKLYNLLAMIAWNFQANLIEHRQ